MNGRSYDSKAIAGVAHGYLPGETALTPDTFSGGEATVQNTLERLGFTVIHDAEFPPSSGDVLTNEEIGRRFVVGNMGGMRRSNKRNLLVLISDPFKGLYQDRWEGEVLHYTGMGPSRRSEPDLRPKSDFAPNPPVPARCDIQEELGSLIPFWDSLVWCA